MELSYLIGFVIIILIVILFVYHTVKKTISRHLAGLWKICPLFAKSSQLHDFIFHINEKNNIGYLLASNPSGVILNTVVTMKFQHKKCTRTKTLHAIPDMVEYKITFEYPDASDEEKEYNNNLFPSEQYLTIYPMASRIIMCGKDGTLTGIFTKDPASIPHDLLPEILSQNSEGERI